MVTYDQVYHRVAADLLQMAIGSDPVGPEADEVAHLLEVRADLLKALDLARVMMRKKCLH